MNTPQTARDLLNTNPIVPRKYDGSCPAIGERWAYGDWDEVDKSKATYMILNLTVYSDYAGSMVERSNCVAIKDDFPDLPLIELYGGHGTTGLMVNADCDDECFLEAMTKLADFYPVYDDERMSFLEQEIAWEEWDSWIEFDLKHDMWQAAGKRGIGPDELDKALASRADDWLKQTFYTWVNEDNGVVFEDAVNFYYPDQDKVVERLLDELFPGSERTEK